MTTDHDITHWRNRLNAIDRMLAELPDQLATISSYAMDLAGPAHAHEPPLPGGDILVLTGPWAPDATNGDDTPHPHQTIVEWAHTIYDAHDMIPPENLRYMQALTYLRDQVPWILQSPWTQAWRDDIDAVHGRLAAYCPPEVDHRHDDTPAPPTITEDDLWDALAQHPDTELTRKDLHHLGIPSSTIRTWRQRGHLTPTPNGRYPARSILALRTHP